MTSSIPQTPFETISFIGKTACTNEEKSLRLCKKLLENTPIEEIKSILLGAMQQGQSSTDQQNINKRIGVLTVYREILKKDADPSILSRATKVACSAFGIENNAIQKTRLELFEQIFSEGAGYEEALELINRTLCSSEIDSFIIQLSTLLVQYNQGISQGVDVFNSSTRFEVRERIPLFEALAEKNVNEIKNKLVDRIKARTWLAIDDSNSKEKHLLFIEVAIKKRFYVEEIYNTTSFLFKDSATKLCYDRMQFPAEILNIFVNINCKRDEISELVQKVKRTVEDLEDNDEAMYLKQKKLEYIANLETLISKPVQSIKSARSTI